MPRFHFDTECGGSRYDDPDGVDLPSLEDARQQLAALLRDLTFDSYPDSVNLTASATVRCDGAVVLQGTCTLAIGGEKTWSPRLS